MLGFMVKIMFQNQQNKCYLLYLFWELKDVPRDNWHFMTSSWYPIGMELCTESPARLLGSPAAKLICKRIIIQRDAVQLLTPAAPQTLLFKESFPNSLKLMFLSQYRLESASFTCDSRENISVTFSMISKWSIRIIIKNRFFY